MAEAAYIQRAKAEEAATWKREHYTQGVQAHGDKDQQNTEYAVVKNADMSEQMQQHAVDCVSFAF